MPYGECLWQKKALKKKKKCWAEIFFFSFFFLLGGNCEWWAAPPTVARTLVAWIGQTKSVLWTEDFQYRREKNFFYWGQVKISFRQVFFIQFVFYLPGQVVIKSYSSTLKSSNTTVWCKYLYTIQCVPIKRKPVLSVRYLHCHARLKPTVCFIIKSLFSSFIWYQTHNDISMHEWKGTI